MGHDLQDRVSLEIGRRVAAELPRRPEWLALARENLERWCRANADSPGLLRCYNEWIRILKLPVERVCTILTDESEEGQRLRQNSPFAGALTAAEVWEIKRRIRHEQSAA